MFTKQPDAYLLIARTTKDKFYVRVKPTTSYPKSAKRPYKGTIYLIKDNTFNLLTPTNPHHRPIMSAIMDRVCGFIAQQEDSRIKEDEGYHLLEQNLDDIDV